jgi:phospholipase C
LKFRAIAAAIPLLLLLGTTSAIAAAPVVSPIQHVVVIYQENHSFDNVLGRWCYNSGRCDGTLKGKLPDGRLITLRTATDLVPEMPHDINSQITAIDGGLMDGFAKFTATPTSKGCGQDTNYACMSQFGASQIPNLIKLATRFAVSDRTFQMSNVPSYGAHIELVAATLDDFTGGIPYPGTSGVNRPGYGCDSEKDTNWRRPSDGRIQKVPACIPDYTLDPGLFPYGGAYKATPVQPTPTIMDRLDDAGLSWKLYTGSTNDSLSGYLWAVCPNFAQCLYTDQRNNMVRQDQVLQDAANGNLPSYSAVLPTRPKSQHGSWSMLDGDNWIGQVVDAIANGPDWNSTAIFITYDDCGCFYDHVPPPPGFGIRSPMVIVSPWVRPRYTDSVNASYASMLAFTEHNFGLLPVGTRDRDAYDYSGAFNFTQTPLPPPPMTTTELTPSQREAVRNTSHVSSDGT